MIKLLWRCVIVAVGICSFLLAVVTIGYVTAWGASFITGERFVSGFVGLLAACFCAAGFHFVLSEE